MNPLKMIKGIGRLHHAHSFEGLAFTKSGAAVKTKVEEKLAEVTAIIDVSKKELQALWGALEIGEWPGSVDAAQMQLVVGPEIEFTFLKSTTQDPVLPSLQEMAKERWLHTFSIMQDDKDRAETFAVISRNIDPTSWCTLNLSELKLLGF